jgi:hypothetical protein
LVRKKSGELRMCVDYRQLNTKTRKDAYPLPRIEESIDALVGARLFSTMDLQSAFHQVEVAEEDKAKTGFTTPLGLYEFNRMAFGLCNAPATYQRIMQQVFQQEVFQVMLVYLDDIVAYSRTEEEMIARLEVIFRKLQAAGLKLELRKCSFFKKTVKFLGHEVSEKGIATDPEKVRAAREWPKPRTVKDLRSFLGFASYYRRFVKGFAQIAKPLHQLVSSCATGKRRNQGSVEGQWDTTCQDAFEQLREALTTAPLLGYADYRLPFILETDASNDGLGAVLSQIQDGKPRVIAYASRGLRGGERNMENYSSKKLELLALKWAVTDKFRDYLLGGRCTIFTDNNPLTHIMTQKKLPALEQRWVNGLASFDLDIKFRPGKENRNADALSRTPQEMDSESVTTCMVTALQCTVVPLELQNTVLKEMREATSTQCLSADVSATTSFPMYRREDIAKMQRQDPGIAAVLHHHHLGRKPDYHERQKLSQDALKWVRQVQNVIEDDGLVYRAVRDPLRGMVSQLLVPPGLQVEVLSGLHDGAGHQGRERTEALIRDKFYWPGVRASVGRWIECCKRCTVAKMPYKPLRTPMDSIYPLNVRFITTSGICKHVCALKHHR